MLGHSMMLLNAVQHSECHAFVVDGFFRRAYQPV